MPEEKKQSKQPEQNESLERYELVYLISNKFSENELEPITSSVLKLIKDNGGKIIQEENWGKKKLAYPIGQFFYAYYILVEFDLPGAGVEKLNKFLRLSEEIIRYLTVKKRIKTPKEIENEKRIAKKIAEQTEEEKNKKPEKEINKTDSAKKDKRVSMEELDEKLDKILDDTQNLL
ncbi:30S ribosomal protein S6 [Candidatus Falkowbacteria bacterium CG10_big_fil_rev_8_21_14_0_10_43_10]|uniref:Small ribosomal subunit protein bS6 n=1 Tax=Candidatus Falkowbacteria bacterium CG10_big_fil_rev_8_21_14_0_10_43_10 TaxID=1974567 RepID=A0A2H0V2J3_9BACT|nr:MAG: 30S ribosomal protein S6 [Candidatus Falkowbacteria bacterium CG10_big_fil_rev_8_21_14_0_10_43_10]